jgi:hypothetical protein
MVQIYLFLSQELDQLFTTIIERGALFSFVEYSILLALLIRSHPILNSQVFVHKNIENYPSF